MKKFLLAACIISCNEGFGQQHDTLDIEKYLEKIIRERKSILLSPNSRILTPGDLKKYQEIRELTGSDRIKILSQDNMPCITTDLNAFNMPNLFDPTSETAIYLRAGDWPGKMPNVSHPFIMRPVK